MVVFSYIVIAIGALWGILTLIGIREEDKYIQELIKSAEEHSRKSRLSRQSHGSE